MYRLKLFPASFKGAPESLFREAKDRIEDILLPTLVTFTGTSPDVIYFISGGSEREALEKLDSSKFQILAAFGGNNAYASASEVHAYAKRQGFRTLFLSLDNSLSFDTLRQLQVVREGLGRLRGQNLGLIGEVSDWLVASSVDPDILKDKMGIHLLQLPWKEAGKYTDHAISLKFIEKYDQNFSPGMEDASRVSVLLGEVIKEHQLDAITVECFSLVQKNGVTACLALSDLNDLGVPSGCEGDVVSIAGMMLAKEITGQIPWMANLAGIHGNKVLFAHCTAPTNLLGDFSIKTHYETNKGTAIEGYFKGDAVTIFRFDSVFNRAFVTEGTIVDRPTHPFACRTQVEVLLRPESIRSLSTDPLGNHHLVLPGNLADLIRMASRVLLMETLPS